LHNRLAGQVEARDRIQLRQQLAGMVLNFGDVCLGFFQLLAWHGELLCDFVELHVRAAPCA
jgi:hypothetical protein